MKDSKEKLSALDALSKRLAAGDDDISDLLMSQGSISERLTQARNLSEEALAKQILDNTGVPIPGKGSSKLKVEDFLQRLLAERYPELKSNVKIIDNPDVRGDKVLGYYSPTMDEIGIGSHVVKRSPTEAVATLFHEGAHGYDSKVLNQPGSDKFDAEAVRERLKINPNESADNLYELAAKRHHAKIPKLREGTFGLRALKSYLKSGTFRALGPVATAASALSAGSASDALADTVIPGGVESLGAGSDQMLTPDQQQNVEKVREVSSTDTLTPSRFKALQGMVKRR